MSWVLVEILNYRNLYKNIQDFIKTDRDLLNNISLKLYDSDKIHLVIAEFEKNMNVSLNSNVNKLASLTKTLIRALININDYTLKSNLSSILFSGVSSDGSISSDACVGIKKEILNLVGITRDIDDDEFTFLVDILNYNVNSISRNSLLLNYAHIINVPWCCKCAPLQGASAC